jgi:hypothetical protein
MAKIMYGSLAGAISGALGNDVFSHNRHGAYIRRRVIPTKVVSDYTTEVRNNLTSCSRDWAALTPEKQMAWNTYAQSHPITDRLGQKQTLFGAGAYTQINARMMRAGDSVIDLPPAVAAPSPLLTLSAVATEDDQECILTFTPATLGATERLWVQAALMVAPGASYFKNLLKLVTVDILESVTGVDIGPDIEERFGTFATGNRIVLLASVFSNVTGLLSGPTLATTTVVAS